MKTCLCCKKEKQFSDFYKHKRGKNGLREICKKCHIIKTRKYDTPQKKKLRSKKWEENNIDKRKKINKKFSEKNKGSLSNRVVKHRLRDEGFSVDAIKQNPELVELKRNLIILKRTIKQKQNGKK